MPPYAYT
jgi:hypothetical protein